MTHTAARPQPGAGEAEPGAELAEQIAALVLDKLTCSVIDSSLPAEIGDWVRQTAKDHSMFWVHSIPMQPHGSALIAEWVLNPDGTIRLALNDTNNRVFWRGVFRPVTVG